MTESIAYRFRVPDEVAALIRSLHPVLKANIRQALQVLIREPHAGKALKEELAGLRSYRVKKFRIIYRVLKPEKILEILTVGPRKNIYEETFRLVSGEKPLDPM